MSKAARELFFAKSREAATKKAAAIEAVDSAAARPAAAAAAAAAPAAKSQRKKAAAKNQKAQAVFIPASIGPPARAPVTERILPLSKRKREEGQVAEANVIQAGEEAADEFDKVVQATSIKAIEGFGDALAFIIRTQPSSCK
jgi:hypothetical protein